MKALQSIAIVLMCILAAVAYGIVHDQVTARVCVEYFTVGHPPVFGTDDPKVLGLGWGVIATWWVGLLLGIPLAAVARAGSRPKRTVGSLVRPVAWLLVVTAVCALIAGLTGWLLARSGVVFLVGPIADELPPDRHIPFLADLWAHTASYLVGIVGGLVVLVRVRRSRGHAAEPEGRETPALAHASGSGEVIVSDELTTVRTAYDRWAIVYDHDGNPLQALEGPILRSAVGNVRGLAVLDLGCGTGRHSLWLAAAGASVTAIDFSDGMLAEARKKPGADAVRWFAHDLHTPLPFANGTFDSVVSGLVLEHLQELDGFFAEARRVLRAGGRVVISAMHPAMFLRGAQARFTDPVSGEVVQPGSVPHSVSAFVMAAGRAGFKLESIHEYAPDAALAERVPRAAKYVGWPMLVLLQLRV